ncbi:arginase [Fusarium agapanthi]|uniref:Arginase n=1 Tax=Fusarium agapanthi TaxID=1803897 RepID=A0A9P5E9B0_9HYPO|nr:arginase [Fusarium agapanthi]
MSPAKSITILSSPYHLGIRDVAVGAGPTALLDAGIVEAIRDLGVTVNVWETELADYFDGDISRLFELLHRTSVAVDNIARAGEFPVILAGNCSITVGVQAGLTAALGAIPSCVWFDAHDDFNTPDVLKSGYLDSMPVAMMAGFCWKTLLANIHGFEAMDLKKSLVHCGMRDVTDLERSRVDEAGFPVIWGDLEQHVDFEGELGKVLDKKKFGQTMVHLDLDALDISVGCVNKFSAHGGLLEDDLEKCLKMIPLKTKPVSLTIASFDPLRDVRGTIEPVAIKGVVAFVQGLISQGYLEKSSDY